jgi:hypothetical protein
MLSSMVSMYILGRGQSYAVLLSPSSRQAPSRKKRVKGRFSEYQRGRRAHICCRIRDRESNLELLTTSPITFVSRCGAHYLYLFSQWCSILNAKKKRTKNLTVCSSLLGYQRSQTGSSSLISTVLYKKHIGEPVSSFY